MKNINSAALIAVLLFSVLFLAYNTKNNEESAYFSRCSDGSIQDNETKCPIMIYKFRDFQLLMPEKNLSKDGSKYLAEIFRDNYTFNEYHFNCNYYEKYIVINGSEKNNMISAVCDGELFLKND